MSILLIQCLNHMELLIRLHSVTRLQNVLKLRLNTHHFAQANVYQYLLCLSVHIEGWGEGGNIRTYPPPHPNTSPAPIPSPTPPRPPPPTPKANLEMNPVANPETNPEANPEAGGVRGWAVRLLRSSRRTFLFKKFVQNQN